IAIGPAAASKSYLSVDRIVEACKASNADAVHPGYGFLSEQALFAERLTAAGVVFIGPKPHALASMGDKLTSKQLAKSAGVSVIPGSADAVADAQAAVRAARAIGYPVMLKASAGGGGKGMRLAANDAECREGFERATQEAAASFGDGRVFVEKYIEQPRHIEIQVLADGHGTVLHLGERECSLQRRHQKVIEECPSSLLDARTRAAMGQQAVALARAVDYQSAGTVEFVVDPRRNFYFLEMNTRLQVEHPVTELVTGIDLVEWMIRIAAGERLELKQEDIRFDGWALESRVYAEDPSRGFLPSIGRLKRFQPPAASKAVRVDTGVFEGAEVSMHYDPMIAKLVTHGETRDAAIERMRESLNEFVVRGPANNIAFLAAIVGHPRFLRGELSTQFISEEFPDGYHASGVRHTQPELLISVAAAVFKRGQQPAMDAGQTESEPQTRKERYVVLLDGESHEIAIACCGTRCDVQIDGTVHRVESEWRRGELLFRGNWNGRAVHLQVDCLDVGYRITHDGVQVNALVVTPRIAELLRTMPAKSKGGASKHVLSPMPGMLVQMMVELGQTVRIGQPLAVIEAMKMQNPLNADRDGKIVGILASVGETLAVDQPILEFE
ncbi:MAG: Acetyl-/propionyl-coenzyme carboxylase alpha chain, partial [Planctomycetota bacterium]